MIILLFVLLLIQSQPQCLDHAGISVKWWVALKMPISVSSGYAYYDSGMFGKKFIVYNTAIDAGATPLSKTFELIKSTNNQHVAWNDQKPDNHTSSSRAHSKGIISYNKEGKGMLITHSIPKYPQFNDHIISNTISQAQLIYGQHIACLSLSLYQLNKLAMHLLITEPYVYESTIRDLEKSVYIYKLAQSNFPKSKEVFQYQEFRPQGYLLKSIYKNKHLNGSIFEDAMTENLKVDKLIAQTWGRPLETSWCTKNYQVLNVKTVTIANYSWTQTKDHSKWVWGTEYACFGDLNRMTSQWKRGGAFYCLKEEGLAQALKAIITTADYCNSTNAGQPDLQDNTSENLRGE